MLLSGCFYIIILILTNKIISFITYQHSNKNIRSASATRTTVHATATFSIFEVDHSLLFVCFLPRVLLEDTLSLLLFCENCYQEPSVFCRFDFSSIFSHLFNLAFQFCQLLLSLFPWQTIFFSLDLALSQEHLPSMAVYTSQAFINFSLVKGSQLFWRSSLESYSIDEATIFTFS